MAEAVVQAPEAADQLIQEIGASIVTHEEYREGWDSLAVVGSFKDGERRQYGYVYLDNGKFKNNSWEARIPGGFATLKLMKRLNDEMAEATGKRWHRCLVQIKRADMDMNIQFEYDDPDRWSVSPATVERDALALKPE